MGDRLNTEEQSEKLNLYGTVWLNVWKEMACISTNRFLETVLIDILSMVLQWMKKVHENKQISFNDMAPTKKSSISGV